MTRVLLVTMLLVGCGTDDDAGVRLGPSFVCLERPDDQTGMLRPICEYMVSQLDHYPVDPNSLSIVDTLGGVEAQTRFTLPEYASSDYVFVGLSCCYTGDWAVVHTPDLKVERLILGGI